MGMLKEKKSKNSCTGKRAESVHKKVLLLIQFYKEFGRTPIYREQYEGVRIGNFYNHIKQGTVNITEEDRKSLEDLGLKLYTISNNIRVSNKISLVVEFYEKYGRTPKRNETYKNEKIGNFYRNVKYGITNISEKDHKLLKDAGIDITIRPSFSESNAYLDIRKKILLIIDFYNEFGREPNDEDIYKGMDIGIFWRSIKYSFNKISKEDKLLLQNSGLNMCDMTNSQIVHNKVLLLIEFYKRYSRTPFPGDSYKYVKIGTFYARIKQRETKISTEDRNLLLDLGINLDVVDHKKIIHEKVLVLKDFYEKYNRCPYPYEEYKGFIIYSFWCDLRCGRLNISKEDEELLKKYNFLTNRELKVHNKVLLLVDFYKKFGRTPKVKEEYKNEKIGLFLYSIKLGKTSLLDEDRKLLETLNIKLKR